MMVYFDESYDSEHLTEGKPVIEVATLYLEGVWKCLNLLERVREQWKT